MQIVWDFLTSSGVTQIELETLKQIYILLLLLPIVSTIAGIARYVIGTKSLSIYSPIILTFLFYEFGKTESDQDIIKGLKYGIIIFATVFLSSALFYSGLRKLRMNYIPKLTLVLIGVSISLILLVFLSLLIGRSGLVFINQYTFIIATIVSEPLISAIARKGFRYSLITAIDTLSIAIFSYIVISIASLQTFVQNNPWILIIIILLNVYIGRFTGLRLTEYWRFRHILFANNEVNDNSGTNTKK